MSEQEIIPSPAFSRREDARDLQSRLYREIGLAAVEAALFAPEQPAVQPVELRRIREDAPMMRVIRAA